MLDGLVKSESENKLYLIPVEGIAQIFSEVAPLLIPAIDRSGGRTDIYHVQAALLMGMKQLWVSRRDDKIDCAMVAYFMNFPLKRVYALEFVGGRVHKNWLHFEPDISAWAKANGAVELIGYWRRGWFRVVKGWFPLWEEVRRPL